MKNSMTLLISVALFMGFVPAMHASDLSVGDKTITRVVKLLESMLDTSKDEGNTERVLYAKYKCYCDDKEDKKTKEIATLEEEIALLENAIAGLLADNAIQSSTLAKAKADIADNIADRNKATGVRNAENSAWVAQVADLNKAILSCNSSIVELSNVGADQTLEVGADHKQFMAGRLLQLKANVKQALLAAAATSSHKQEQGLQSFLQSPFTGTYTSQAGEVFGIIKDMRDTFMLNVADLNEAEAKSLKAYNEYIANKLLEHGAHVLLQTNARTKLSGNLLSLTSMRASLGASETGLKNAKKFLDDLTTMCEKKAKEYNHRVMLRTNEEAAIAEAIGILNSDAAFATFDTVSATSTGATGFIQLRSIRRHLNRQQDLESDPGAKRQRIAQYLRGKAASTHSNLLSKIVALLEVDNPFDTVLAKIGDMIDIIADEEKVDDEHFTWCNDERSTTQGGINGKNLQIGTLNGEITGLKTLMYDPTTGLEKKIDDTETALKENQEDQVEETENRKESEAAYRKDIANLVDAEELLEQAAVVLEKYYQDAEGAFKKDATKYTFLQMRPTAAPPVVAPPSTWTGGGFTGQSTDGNSAITMLRYIQTQTKTEETTAHTVEQSEQEAYEDEMKRLTDAEATYVSDLATYKGQMAEKEKELAEKNADLKATEKDKAELEAYMASIKPGCDFITNNIDLRKSNRDEEKTALETARNMIKGSPAYKTAVALAHNESLGDCLEFCAGSDEDTAPCKACLAKVTVPAYCAGHPTTTGC